MRRSTFICRKHNYTRKSEFGGRCPVCHQDLKSIGDKKRIGHRGQFDKVERKTRKLEGQRKVMSHRQKRLNFLKRLHPL